MGKAHAVCVLTYLVAGAVAVAAGYALSESDQHPIVVAGVADVAATVVVFLFGVAVRNASLYDPYWSVAPVPIALYWALGAEPDANVARQVIAIALVGAWAVRLTWNWLRGWSGLDHEDWRYVDLRASSGRAYPLVNFFGIHFFPTLMVFLGCLALYPALTSDAPLGVFDGVAVLVTAVAIAIEATADQQLRRFVIEHPRKQGGAILRTGLWSRSRHPNYFGEMLFWWGLFVFALAAAPAWWWTIVGALAMTAMFRFISLPLIERRMEARRPGWAAYAETTPLVIPRILSSQS
jgi:steroid 5-alpha reductase family enzyme